MDDMSRLGFSVDRRARCSLLATLVTVADVESVEVSDRKTSSYICCRIPMTCGLQAMLSLGRPFLQDNLCDDGAEDFPEVGVLLRLVQVTQFCTFRCNSSQTAHISPTSFCERVEVVVSV